MITNNINKVKGCKSPKDQQKDVEPDKKPKNFERDEGDKDSFKRGQLSVRGGSTILKEPKPRGRTRDDFRMARGGSGSVEKRGAFRGRGVYSRKSERDGDTFNSRIIKNTAESSIGSSKHNADSRSKTDLGNMVPEDCRISKVLRRLYREEESEKFIFLCKQLQDGLAVPENSHYIRRSMENILDALLDLLHSGPGSAAKAQVATCIGHVGYVLDTDFKRFIDWVFQNYSCERNTDVKCLLLDSLRQTLILEADCPKLKAHAVNLMKLMQSTLEAIDLPDLFVASVEVIMQLSSLYPETLPEYFRDLVDILVGWLIDSSQTAKMTDYAACSLQRLAPYWIQELNFSITFLGQFLEDMEIYGDDFVKSLSPEELLDDDDKSKHPSTEDCIFKVEAFIKSFNTVTKALGDHMSPSNCTAVTWGFLGDCLAKMLTTVKSVLDVRINEDLIIAANECIWLLLSHLQTKTTPGHDQLYEMYDFLLSHVDNLSNATICSVLQVIAKTVREVSANLPLQLVQNLLSPQSCVLALRFSPSKPVRTAVLGLYHALLNLKNIPLLQEAYRYVLGDLEIAYRQLLPSIEILCQNNPFDGVVYLDHESEIVILFLLQAIADLANASNSIIGMWALKPSMFELLAVRLKPLEIRKHIGLHYALLFLLSSHCSKYNHFVSSSSLVQMGAGTRKPRMLPGLPASLNTDVPVTSPTSSNLTNILVLLKDLLSEKCALEVDLLLLSWVRELISQGAAYLPSLMETSEMQGVLFAVVCKGRAASHKLLLSSVVCGTLQLILSFQNISWRGPLLASIMELCLDHVNSTSEEVAALYSHLLSALPWNVTLPILQDINSTAHVQNPDGSIPQKLCWAHSAQLSRNETGLMTALEFRQFMTYLLNGEQIQRHWVLDIFSRCWPAGYNSALSDTEPSSDTPKTPSNAQKDMNVVAKYCLPVLLQWAAWDAAQFCVTSKLRTPLGKPQETFTTIEGAIKSLARAVSADWDVRRVRLLLDFLEQLEKVIHNAADGTALAIEAPPKLVRNFFHTNRSTCAEWLARVRLAAVAVSLRAGQAAAAVRQGQALIQYLHETGNTLGAEMERAVMHVSCALCHLNEWEAVQGLYVWAKSECGRKFPLMKPLAEQAAGRLEQAAEGFLHLLGQDGDVDCVDADAETDLQIREVADDHLTECYRALQDWEKLANWKETRKAMPEHATNGNSLMLSTLKKNQAQSFAEYEAGRYEAAARLLEWDKEPEVRHSWNTVKTLRAAHSNLVSIAVGLAGEEFVPVDADLRSKWISYVAHCQQESHILLKEGLRNTPSELLLEAAVIQYAASGLVDVLSPNENGPLLLPILSETDATNLKQLSSGILSGALWWSEFLDHMGLRQPPSALSELRVATAQSARKEKNLGFAVRLLSRELGVDRGSSLVELANTALQLDSMSFQTLKEVAKVLYAADMKGQAVCVVAHGAQRGPKLLLTLAKWLQAEPNLAVSGANGAAISSLLDQDPACGADLLDIQNCSLLTQNGVQVIPTTDTIVGRLLRLAVVQSPQIAKAWAHFANWCYRWGRRAVDVTSEMGGQLTAADKACVQAMLPADASGCDVENVLSILVQTRAAADEEDIDLDNTNTSEMMEAQLRNVDCLQQANSATLSGLVGVWREAQQRVYSCYQLAAIAYFKFLQLQGLEEACVDDCATVTAALRLLRLVVKHALELQSVLEAGLAATPTAPWKAIIPQLFSRMGHPEAYVRRRVAELLCRLAEDAPHLISFPAVVGAASGGARLRHMPMPGTTRLFDTYLTPLDGDSESCEDDDDEEDEEEEEEEEDSSGSGQAVLKNCFLAMVETLSKQAPEAIAQVQQLVCELRRITLLWDELWLGTITQHQAEISRRVAQLNAEIARVDNNSSLSAADREKLVAEKYRIIVKPLVFIFEQLHAITSVVPETPHECHFQEKYGKLIEAVVQNLKEPTDCRRPELWHNPLKTLQSRLNQRMHKRTAHTVRMEDVSPRLAAMKDTCIAMPGVASGGKGTRGIITIASVHNLIFILPTKTKPKKLVFCGSDGKPYTYLFKGLEDLHLDERIMQLLNITNTMLQGESTYRARHYSVIPLGPRSGLISWVDHVTPLFGLYKRWQQRQAIAQAAKNGVPVAVKRPSELFYQKLTPRLKEKGVSLESRKEWPLSVLREVLLELMAETPSQLLAKELWCHSSSAGAWWNTVRTYSRSVAVMSVIGYIIGLGDRHLDNVLVDLTTGEVVHIDYNVCFEKGKTLRVPEKVPFRMTPNIKAALGVTGVEGMFRTACEHVLKVVKKGRETLLTLLEAFVYDPLIDWTTGNEGGYAGAVYGGGQAVPLESKQSRKELEREVTRSMFAIRAVEMRADWVRNRDDVVAGLGEVLAQLGLWQRARASLRDFMDQLQDCHSLLALVKEAEVQMPSRTHPLCSLPVRYAGYRQARDAQDSARRLLRDRLRDCELQLQQYHAALTCLRSSQLAQISVPMDQESYMVFDLVKEFLQNAGQSQMVLQCQQLEAEMGSLAVKQGHMMRTCVDLLNQYGAVSGLFPASYINKHRMVCYQRWASALLQELSVNKCQEVVAEFGLLFSPPPVNGIAPQRQLVMNFAYNMQKSLAEANMRLQKSYSVLRGEASSDICIRLEAACVEAETALNKLRVSEASAGMAVESVATTALVALNKRFLMMEAASASAGECLVDLTSREGEWFLDDMCLMSGMMVKISSLLSTPLPDAVQYLSNIHNLYRALQELNINFASIILPEALVALQTQNPSVLSIIAELNSVIESAPLPLQDIVERLDVHLSCLAIGVDSPHNDIHRIVADLRNKFDDLVNKLAQNSSANDGTMSAGEMLLMGFNGLFEKLYLDGHTLAPKLCNINMNIPICWKNLDHIREARAFSGKMMDETTRPVLEDIFLLKRLQTMRDFFWMCSAVGRGYRGEMPEPGDPPIHLMIDEDRLIKPVRKFTADFVSRMLLGVMTHTSAVGICKLLLRMDLNVTGEVEQRDIGAESKVPLEELCHKAVERCCGARSSMLAQVSAHVSALEACWRRREAHAALATSISLQTATVQRLQLAFTAHHWLHDASVQLHGMPPPAPAPGLSPPALSRAALMRDLQCSLDALVQLRPRFVEVRDRQVALVSSVEQRLKWASGANPALSEVMAAFACAVQTAEERMQREQSLAALVASTCSGILQHEVMRTAHYSKGLQLDTAFLQLVDQCEKSCHLSAETGEAITAAEESLLRIVPLEGQIDRTWIQKAEASISDNVKTVQQKMVEAQEALVKCQEGVRLQVSTLRSYLVAHNRLVGDVRPLLKSMAKFEECALVGLAEYLVRYRAYSEQLCSLTRQLGGGDGEELTESQVSPAIQQTQLLKDNTSAIYEDLLGFATPLGGEDPPDAIGCGRGRRPPLVRQNSVCMSPRKGVPISEKEMPRDPHTGKAVQERNAYAMSVWRRVRMKLEGRDPDPARRATVAEQVDFIINEATNLDNLALLYEGWTPWV